MNGKFVLLALALAGLLPSAWGQNTNRFELKTGDRVVLLGDTLIERERLYGHVEQLLVTEFPESTFTVRNLGWSADTPEGQARVSFDHTRGPEAWFQQLTNQVAQLHPTVVILGYGMANSFDGEAGVSPFIAGMKRLWDAIQHNAGETPVRWIVLSPIKHEMLPPPLPAPERHNAQLERYAMALRSLADERHAHFVDLFALIDSPRALSQKVGLITDDGIHLNDYGYRRMAEAVAASLGWLPHTWRIGITKEGTRREGSYGAKLVEMQQSSTNAHLILQAEQLVPAPITETNLHAGTPTCRIQVVVLTDGDYDLKIDGVLWGRVDAKTLKSGLPVRRGPFFDQAELLRQAIVRKNELFFYRWRPQNNTYLFLFRKHEQGQNAKEIPQFDPMIEDMEKQIAALSRPRPHTFEVVPASLITAPFDRVTPVPLVKQYETAAPPTSLPLPEFDLDPNLQISLYAENPLLAKPIHMNFDARGRLWVASSAVYPQIKPGQEANDKIIILEDTDGDGKAEKSTVFADGLLIPTGVEPGDGGAYVAQSTELLHFKDVDGDGRADQRRVVLSAFGTEDTHHILHTLRWGPDGQLYMNQSIYIHSHIETPHGVVRLNSGGILNLRPGTMELGILAKGLVNTWGHAFDRYGQSFMTDGASAADPGLGGIFSVVPQGMYFTYATARRTLNSASAGSYPKFAGLEYLRSRHFPDDWQGSFVTCDFRAHRVTRFSVSEQGAGYVTEDKPDLIRSKDVSFRPIDAKMGPDGALYIADWSNPIIQHGEVDFRDPRRDHEHGRIWRVTYKGRRTEPVRDLTKFPVNSLLDVLLSPNDYSVRQARRLLTERGTNLAVSLGTWVKRNETNEMAGLQALWLYQSIDHVQPELLEKMLTATDPHIRAAAVRVLSFWQERLPENPVRVASAGRSWPAAPLPLAQRSELPTERALALLEPRVHDSDPRVRLEALRALARIPQARAADLTLTVLDQPMDRFLDYALWLTINDLAQPWLDALQAGTWKIEGREKQLEFGLKALEPAQASTVLTRLLGDKPLPRDGSGPWMDLIGQAGTPRELQRLFEQILAGGFDAGATARALDSLLQSSRLRQAKPTGDLASLGKLLDSPDDAVRLSAVRLAGVWKLAGAPLESLSRLAKSESSSPALRAAALTSMREVGGERAIALLAEMLAATTPAPTRRAAVLALAGLRLDKAAPTAVEILNASATEADALAFWRELLNLKGAAPALIKALPKTDLSTMVAKAGLRAAREGGRHEPDLVLALTRGANLAEGELSLTEAELKQLATDVLAKGDAVRGESLYRRKDLSCTACHSIGGVGGKVGPDMTSLGASAQVDYLIESVWFPNRKIKEGYHAIQIETKDGQEFAGVLVRENSEQLVVRDATGREIAVAKNNIANRTTSNTSLMPAGLIDGLNPQERMDLFRFLSELGKPGPFDSTKGNIARLWRFRPGIHTLEQFGEDRFVKSDTHTPEWLPVYTRVNGELNGTDINDAIVLESKYHGLTGVYAASGLQLAKAGAVKLKFASAPEAIWIDGKSVPAAAELSAELATGTHAIVVRLDAKKLPAALRLESSDGTFEAN